jgi:hypothetical protein
VIDNLDFIIRVREIELWLLQVCARSIIVNITVVGILGSQTLSTVTPYTGAALTLDSVRWEVMFRLWFKLRDRSCVAKFFK